MTGDKGARAAYKRYLDARAMQLRNENAGPVAVGEMQAAMLDALQSGANLPYEMRLHLALAFEYLCAGVAFDLLTPIKRPGGREPPIAKHAQQDGIRYLRWCADGRIDDAAAVSTVATAYQVCTATIRNWRSAWADRPTTPLFEDYGKEEVTAFMKASGGAYMRFKPKAKARRKR